MTQSAAICDEDQCKTGAETREKENFEVGPKNTECLEPFLSLSELTYSWCLKRITAITSVSFALQYRARSLESMGFTASNVRALYMDLSNVLWFYIAVGCVKGS